MLCRQMMTSSTAHTPINGMPTTAPMPLAVNIGPSTRIMNPINSAVRIHLKTSRAGSSLRLRQLTRNHPMAPMAIASRMMSRTIAKVRCVIILIGQAWRPNGTPTRARLKPQGIAATELREAFGVRPACWRCRKPSGGKSGSKLRALQTLRVSGLLRDDAVGVASAAHGRVIADEALAVQVVEAIVHEGHALFAPGLDGVLQLVDLVLPDQVAHRAVGDDQLIREHATSAVGGGQEFLGDNPLQRVGHLENDLPLRAALENAHDSLQRVGDTGRVH